MKKIYVKPHYTDEELINMEGEFFDESFFTQIVNEDADVYTLNEDDEPRLLFKLRKKIIPKKLAHQPVITFKHVNSTNYRGKATGKVDATKISSNSNFIGYENPDSFRSKLVYKDGTVTNYYRSNTVDSMIVGYFDKPKISNRSKVLKEGMIPCRMTHFTAEHKKEWQDVLPLINEVDRLYEKLMPEQYMYQKYFCEEIPDYCIEDTIFSTITVNANWRTACHVDSGDLVDGYSALTVAEKGEWSGCCLGYPKYKIALNLREGDLLIKDPHEHHCNTEFRPLSADARRISMVYYFREGMLNCSRHFFNKKV